VNTQVRRQVRQRRQIYKNNARLSILIIFVRFCKADARYVFLCA